MRDPSTGRPLFTTRCIELVCEKCKEDGKSQDCVSALPPLRYPSPLHSRPSQSPFRPPSPVPPPPPPPLPTQSPPDPPPHSPAARPARRASRPSTAPAPSAARASHAFVSQTSLVSQNRLCACLSFRIPTNADSDSVFYASLFTASLIVSSFNCISSCASWAVHTARI